MPNLTPGSPTPPPDSHQARFDVVRLLGPNRLLRDLITDTDEFFRRELERIAPDGWFLTADVEYHLPALEDIGGWPAPIQEATRRAYRTACRDGQRPTIVHLWRRFHRCPPDSVVVAAEPGRQQP